MTTPGWAPLTPASQEPAREKVPSAARLRVASPKFQTVPARSWGTVDRVLVELPVERDGVLDHHAGDARHDPGLVGDLHHLAFEPVLRPPFVDPPVARPEGEVGVRDDGREGGGVDPGRVAAFVAAGGGENGHAGGQSQQQRGGDDSLTHPYQFYLSGSPHHLD
ncbi:MAG TPA: hypothetical protein VG034_05920 [Acidimicrobiia bacterium]|nr:hypothetical protein [Acidimicrobiia bacterium]